MKTTTNENRPGRFANLLSGGAKPRRSFALMMALVLVGMLSLAGVVSADSYFTGLPPETVVSDSVTGDVDVLYANTWTTPDNVVSDSSWANFTLQAPATGKTLKFARLYVVVYSGNSTANFKGNETIKLYNSDTLTTTLADHQPLDLAYDRTQGIALNPSVSAPFTTLSRVTSDYLSVFDVKDYVTSNTINVHIMTMNESLDIDTGGVGRFDGRIKEAKIVYGWDDTSSTGVTYYMINEGQDPRTYFGDGTAGVTEFAVPDIGTLSSATLYTDDIASANGVYMWNGVTVTPTTLGSNSYARLNQFTLNPNSDIYQDDINTLTYNRVGNYYKIALAILKLKSPT